MATRIRSNPLMMLLRLALLGAALFALVYASLFVYMLVREYTVPDSQGRDFDAMIVLGAQVNPDGQPSKQVELRLQMALDAYRQDPMPIVVCGAQGVDEPMTEAAAMRLWLVGRGVNETHVQMEEESFNTQQNISNAISILPQGTVDVLIITSDYHLPRAISIAKDLGLNPGGLGSPILREFWLKNHGRETLAWGKYYIKKYLPFLPVE